MTYQRLQIIGHLGRDPEMRYTPSGQPVTDFSVATSRNWIGGDGQRREETTWFKVTVWGKQAETCNQYLSKGRLVMCEGRLASQINIWTDREGNARAGYEMTANVVQFLGGGRSDDGGSSYSGGYDQNRGNQGQSSGQNYVNQPPAPDYGDGGIQEDEIPF